MPTDSSPSVIVADNNEFYRKVLKDFYAQLGFDVRVASDGIEALERLQERRPDLMVLDLIMPRIDGAQLCAWIKGSETYGGMPVIILSGILSDEIEDVESIRADAYVAKMPLDQIARTLQEISLSLVRGPRPGPPLMQGFEKMYRREVVLELLQERKRRNELLDSLSEGIAELSSDRRVLRTNEAMNRMGGAAGNDILSRRLEEIFPESGARLLALFDGLEAGAPMADVEIRHGDRELRAKLHRLEPERSGPDGAARRDDGGPGPEPPCGAGGFMLLLDDITARARAEREREDLRARLAQSEKLSAIGLFVSGAAHELNNPLTSILGYAQLLRQRQDGTVARDLDRIRAGAERCREIVENLMAFAGEGRPRRVPADLNVLLMEAASSLREHMAEIGCDLELDLAPDLPPTHIDPGQIAQAFAHILDNAVRAAANAPGRRSLSVRSSREGEWLIVEVTDPGPGIPEDQLGRVFDPFFTTRQVGQGQGLGLSVAYGIVTAHSGRIGARNRVEGGTTVRVDLPWGEPQPGDRSSLEIPDTSR